MIVSVAFNAGGYDPGRAHGNASRWLDTDTRTAWLQDAAGVVTSRPFNPNENAYADAVVGPAKSAAAAQRVRDEISAGMAALATARDAARSDIAVSGSFQATAQGLLTGAQSQRSTAAQFVPQPAYTPSDLTSIRDAVLAVLDRQAQILQSLVDYYGYRAAVDGNAVNTDSALLYLAQLAVDQIPS